MRFSTIESVCTASGPSRPRPRARLPAWNAIPQTAIDGQQRHEARAQAEHGQVAPRHPRADEEAEEAGLGLPVDRRGPQDDGHGEAEQQQDGGRAGPVGVGADRRRRGSRPRRRPGRSGPRPGRRRRPARCGGRARAGRPRRTRRRSGRRPGGERHRAAQQRGQVPGSAQATMHPGAALAGQRHLEAHLRELEGVVQHQQVRAARRARRPGSAAGPPRRRASATGASSRVRPARAQASAAEAAGSGRPRARAASVATSRARHPAANGRPWGA